MSNKFLIIDGSSLLSTSFFGFLPKEYKFAKNDEERDRALPKLAQTSDGQYTNGVFTMMKTLEKIIEKQKPTYLAVAWDLNRNTFRRQIYPQYKANRSSTRPELKSQFPIAQEVLRKMNIPQFVIDGYEADDILGTFSKKFEETIPVFILTKDQDALQLISEKTRVWLMTSNAQKMYEEVGVNASIFSLPDNVFEFTPDYMKHFYGITPKQMIDLKGICGDTSDNIPGVKGVGDKSAVPLLCEFQTVEAIYEYLEETNDKELKAFFKELGIRNPYSYMMKTSDTELVGKESALLSKKLATIHCEMEELKDVKLEDLELNIDKMGRKEVYEKFEFKSLLESKEK
jgi:5'-3' exonuclease